MNHGRSHVIEGSFGRPAEQVASLLRGCIVWDNHGCMPVGPAVPTRVFDLGLPHAAAPGVPALRLRIAEVKAPSWLADTRVQYRLQFRDEMRREAYRDSRWAAPPAALWTLRLNQRLAQPGCAEAGAGEALTPAAGQTSRCKRSATNEAGPRSAL